MQLVTRRKGRGKLGHARIEIRRAHFQTHRHAGAIDFRQDVFGQIKLRVQALHAFRKIVRVAFGKQATRLTINIRITCLPRFVGKQQVLIVRRKRAEPGMMPGHFIVMRGGNESPRAIVEREIPGLNGQ